MLKVDSDALCTVVELASTALLLQNICLDATARGIARTGILPESDGGRDMIYGISIRYVAMNLLAA